VSTMPSVNARPCPMESFVFTGSPAFAGDDSTLVGLNPAGCSPSGRARGDGVDAAAGEALLHVGHVEDLDDSALRLSRTGCGVALGANSAVQLEASTSFTPSCCNVGHSGLSVERLPMVTASTRTRPLLTCGATEELASTPSGISPAASAAAAGAPPL